MTDLDSFGKKFSCQWPRSKRIYQKCVVNVSFWNVNNSQDLIIIVVVVVEKLLIGAAFSCLSLFGRPCWLWRGSGQVCLGSWIFPTASRGLPPGYYPLRGGGDRLVPEAPPNKGNADGAVGIFGKCPAHVSHGLAPGPTKKGLVPHFHVRWGV